MCGAFMPRREFGRLLLCMCALAAWAGEARALASDKNQPIHIEADSVIIDDSRGVATYRGNVHFMQGSAHLQADEVIVYSADRKVVDKVEAKGSPATFRQRPDNKDEDIRGEARRVNYFAAGEQVILEDAAHLWQGQNEFTGHRIEYHSAEEVVKALKAPDSKARVQVTIQPRQGAQGASSGPETKRQP